MNRPFTNLIVSEPLERAGDVPPGRFGSVFTLGNVGFGNYVTPIDTDVSDYAAAVVADGGVAMSYKEILNLNSFVRLCKANGAWDNLQLAFCAKWGYKLGAGGVSKIYCVKHNRHGEQATAAAQPTYNAAGLSGKPALVFDGVNDTFILSNAANVVRNIGSATVLAVVAKSTAGNQRILHATTATGTTRLSVYASSTNWLTQARRLDADTFTNGIVTNSRLNTSGSRLIAVDLDWSAAVLTHWVNRGTPAVLNPFQTTGLVADTASTVFYIGSAAVEFWSGPIGAVLFFSPALTIAQRQEVELFFATLYGITLDP